MAASNSASQRAIAYSHKMKLGLQLALAVFLQLLVAPGPPAWAQQDPETMTFRLNKVEVNGLQKISREKFLEVSGLKLDQRLKFADLKPVADKLYASGLFAKVNYRYNWEGENLDAIFDVTERLPSTPPISPSVSEPAAAKTPTLGKIEFNGLQRLDSATAAKATGLQMGASLDQKQLNAAAKRLADTGYFSEVNYNYRREGDQMIASFEVTEFKWDVSCIFDNFVWFTPDELRDAIRKEIPGFDGLAPDNEIIPKTIKSALEQLMRQRGVQRGVNFLIGVGDMDSPMAKVKKDFVFTTAGAPMPVCKVAFPGASPQLEKQMQTGVKPLINVDYSNQQFAQYIENMLLPAYRERGYLRAKFGAVQAQPDAGATKKCQNGVNVAVPVEEAESYKLGKFDWAGNQALAMSTMQDLFGMKAGTTANGAKIDKGLSAIKTAYLNQGYLDLKLTVDTSYEEGSRTANFRIAVTEGQPFKMGELVIANASENEQKRIRGKWQLAPGAVFNFSHVREFAKKLSDDRSARVPRVQLQLDRAKQIANVLFTY